MSCATSTPSPRAELGWPRPVAGAALAAGGERSAYWLGGADGEGDIMHGWWHDEVVTGTKGPLLLALVAFVITFVATRGITRLIRAGKGPFHNMNSGGVHLHHATPGVILLVTGAFLSSGADGRSPWNYVSAALIGIGASLVLDEFAMIFHLQDVYWSQEG